VIRVLVAEDQTLVRGALVALLARDPDIEIVAEVASGDAVLPAALETLPDVALLDIEMPGMSGIEAAGELHAKLPGCKILVLTTFGRPGYLRRAMEQGAVGFMVKDAPAAQLALAIRRVVAGERVLDPLLAASALSEGDNPLSDRERAVLQYVRQGATNAEIAATLVLTEGTVRNYLSTAMQKLHATTRVEAAVRAEQKGWL
jgi:two-component system, NarL family, response regulator DesR